jgi:hypothetical protein
MTTFPVPALVAGVLLCGCYDPEVSSAEDASGGADDAGGTDSTDASTGADDAESTDATGPAGSSGSSPGNDEVTSGGETTGGDTTGATGPSCGDAVLDPGEACDEGQATPTCSADCASCTPDTSPAVNQQLGVCVEGPSSDCRDGWSMANGQSGIQAFVPDVDGTLSTVELHVMNEAVATTVMTLYVLDGGDDALFPVGATFEELEASFVAGAAAIGSAEFEWVEFDFGDQAPALETGKNYYLWLVMPEPFPADEQLRIRWNLWASPEVPDPYDGGRSFFCPSPLECDSQLEHWDFAFRTYVSPAPPLCEP